MEIAIVVPFVVLTLIAIFGDGALVRARRAQVVAHAAEEGSGEQPGLLQRPLRSRYPL